MYHCEHCGGNFVTFITPGQCPLCGLWASVRCSTCRYIGSANEFINNGDRCPKCGAHVRIIGGSSARKKPVVWNLSTCSGTLGCMGLIVAGVLLVLFIADASKSWSSIPVGDYQMLYIGIGLLVVCGLIMGVVITTASKKVPVTASSQTIPQVSDVDKIVHEGSGSTQLILACSHGDLEGVRKLLAQGANVNLTNKNGATALDVTYSNGDDIRYRAIYKQIAALLKAKDAKTNKWTGPRF